MADMLDALKDLETSVNWLKGRKSVDDAAKAVQDAAKDFGKLVKEASKVGRDLSFDIKAVKKVMDASGKSAQAVADTWRAQCDAALAAQRTSWPAVESKARDLYRKVTELAGTDGPDSPAFAKALKEAVASTEGYRDDLREREGYAQMVADKVAELPPAFVAADDAATTLVELIEKVTTGLKTFSYSNEKVYRDLFVLRNAISGIAKATARHVQKVADLAAVHASETRREREQAEVALQRLYEMQAGKVLRDVRDTLSDLFKLG